MIEIIPWLPDSSHPESTVQSRAPTELVIDRYEFDTQKLMEFVEEYVGWVFKCSFNSVVVDWTVSADLFDNFLCVPIAMSLSCNVREFMLQLRELPRYLQLLILRDISSARGLADRERIIDNVFTHAEMQRLEKEFPWRVTIQDYYFAHEWYSDGYHRNVDHIRASLEWEVLF